MKKLIYIVFLFSSVASAQNVKRSHGPTSFDDIYIGASRIIDLLAAKQATGDYATNTALTNGLAAKQNTLTAGTNISIIGNTISATSAAEDFATVTTTTTAATVLKNFPVSNQTNTISITITAHNQTTDKSYHFVGAFGVRNSGAAVATIVMSLTGFASASEPTTFNGATPILTINGQSVDLVVQATVANTIVWRVLVTSKNPVASAL